MGLRGLNRLSNGLHDIEVRDLRSRLVAVIVPGAALVALGVAVAPLEGAYRVGELPASDAPWSWPWSCVPWRRLHLRAAAPCRSR